MSAALQHVGANSLDYAVDDPLVYGAWQDPRLAQSGVNHGVLVAYGFYTIRQECEGAQRQSPRRALKGYRDAAAGRLCCKSRQREMAGPL